MICFKCVLVLISFVYILSQKSLEATVVYYIKPTQNILQSRPYFGYGVIPISPVPAPPPLKYVDYRWLNVKNTGVLAVPGIPDSALTLFKYSQPFPPLGHFGHLPYRIPSAVPYNPLSVPVPLAIVPVPYARRLQFIRLRRHSIDHQAVLDTDEQEKDEEIVTNSKASVTERSSVRKE